MRRAVFRRAGGAGQDGLVPHARGAAHQGGAGYAGGLGVRGRIQNLEFRIQNPDGAGRIENDHKTYNSTLPEKPLNLGHCWLSVRKHPYFSCISVKGVLEYKQPLTLLDRCRSAIFDLWPCSIYF